MHKGMLLSFSRSKRFDERVFDKHFRGLGDHDLLFAIPWQRLITPSSYRWESKARDRGSPVLKVKREIPSIPIGDLGARYSQCQLCQMISVMTTIKTVRPRFVFISLVMRGRMNKKDQSPQKLQIRIHQMYSSWPFCCSYFYLGNHETYSQS